MPPAPRTQARLGVFLPVMNIELAVPPIPDAFLRRVRAEGIDDQSQPVKHVIAEGGEPCRDVLRRARPGERLILASFTPFTKQGPYKEYGPIFVLADDDGGDVRRDELPLDGYLREQFVIRAYSDAEEIVDAALIKAADVAATVERLFGRDGHGLPAREVPGVRLLRVADRRG